MRIECFGGAHDGAVFEVPEDCEYVEEHVMLINKAETGMVESGRCETYVRTDRETPEGVAFELREDWEELPQS